MLQTLNQSIVKRPAFGQACNLRHSAPQSFRTDFSMLSGKKVLALADFENLTFSSRQHNGGREPDAGLLLERLRSAARQVTPMAFVTVAAEDVDHAREYFHVAGWKPYVQPHELVRDCRGQRLLANSDPQILLHAGRLIAASRCDAVLLLSGDGDLVSSIIRYTMGLPKRRQVVTCSVEDATSRRILARVNPEVTGNIFIQDDVLVLAS